MGCPIFIFFLIVPCVFSRAGKLLCIVSPFQVIHHIYMTYLLVAMEKQLEELRQQLEKQCLINQELQRQNKDLGEYSKQYMTFRSICIRPVVFYAGVQINTGFRIAVVPTFCFYSETNLIVKAIQKNDFLSRLDDEQIAMMVDLLRTSAIKPGEEVIKEGSEGDSMYIVAAGELIVTQSGRDLRTLTKGDVFGELAILYNCKRTATVKG
uniref:Cyclic nucleotide-binding domain-containing protein n=1 Tax=Fundulus heteroclitus TaxID=8078 RepID=A0A3Q2Q5P4_FUNHE